MKTKFKKPGFKNPKTLRFAITLSLFLVASLGAYFFFYIPSQEDFITKRNFRILKEYSEQITERIKNNAKVLENAANDAFKEKRNTKKSFNKHMGDILKLSGYFDTPTMEYESYNYSDEDLVFNFDAYFQNLKQSDSSYTNRNVFMQQTDQARSDDITLERLEDNDQSYNQKYFSSSFTSKIEYSDGEYFIKYDIEMSDVSTTVYGVVKSNLKNLISPIVDIGIFDEVFVIRDTAEVIYSKGHPEIHSNLFDLSKFVMPDSIHFKEPGKYKSAKSIFTTSINELEIGGENYKLFTQPVRISFRQGSNYDYWDYDGWNENVTAPYKDWVICGLIDSDEFTKETTKISFNFIAAFVVLLLIVIITWPVIKIWKMGPNDRLRLSDIKFLVIASLVGTAIIVVSALDIVYYNNLSSELDDQLKNFSNIISNNFDNELKNVLNQTHRLNKKVTANTFRKQPNILMNIDLFDCDSSHKFIESIAWIDKLGNQKGKWTVDDIVTPLINVSKRDYFKNIINKNYWYLDPYRFYLESIYSWTTGKSEAILSVPFDKSILFKNDKRVIDVKVAAITFEPLSIMDPIIPEYFGYAVLDETGKVLFHSDKNRNLRENFITECNDNVELKAAVYGRTDMWTKVNYYGDDYKIYSMPLNHVPWTIVTFRNLRTLRTSNLEMLSTSIILFSVYLIILFLLYGLVRLIFWRSKVEWIWPKPEYIKAYHFVIASNIVLAIIAFLLLFMVDRFTLIYLEIIIPIIALVLAYIILHVFNDKKESKSRKSKNKNENSIVSKLINIIEKPVFGLIKYSLHKRLFILSIYTLLIVVAFLPAIAMFKFAMDFEKELIIKHIQYNLGNEWFNRKAGVKRTLDKLSIESSLKDQMYNERRNAKDAHDLYYSFFFDTHVIDEEFAPKMFIPTKDDSLNDTEICNVQFPKTDIKLYWPSDKIQKFITHIRPTYAQIAEKTRGLVPDTSVDNLWRSARGSDWHIMNYSTLEKPASQMHSSDIEYIKYGLSNESLRKIDKPFDEKRQIMVMKNSDGSEILITSELFGIFDKNSAGGIIGIVILVGLLFCLFFIVQYIWNKIMFIDFVDTKESLVEIITDDSANRILGICSHYSNKSKQLANLNEKYDLAIEDVADKLKADELTADYANKIKKNSGKIILDHFEQNLQNFVLNKKLLSFLEILVFSKEKPKIIIISVAEPLRIISDFLESEFAQKHYSNSWELMVRWFKVFGEFDKIYVAAKDEDIMNLNKIKERIKKADKNVKKKLENIKEILENECRVNCRLQHIANEILDNAGYLKYDVDEFNIPNAEEIIDDVSNRAHPIYRILWNSFTKNEKLVLIQLAEDGLANYNNAAVIRILMHRGVIKDSPFRIMNESFRRFITQVKKPEDIAIEGTQSSWSALRIPLFVGIAAIVIFLFTTQKELYNYTIGIISAAIAFIPLVARLISSVPLFKGSSAE